MREEEDICSDPFADCATDVKIVAHSRSDDEILSINSTIRITIPEEKQKEEESVGGHGVSEKVKEKGFEEGKYERVTLEDKVAKAVDGEKIPKATQDVGIQNVEEVGKAGKKEAVKEKKKIHKEMQKKTKTKKIEELDLLGRADLLDMKLLTRSILTRLQANAKPEENIVSAAQKAEGHDIQVKPADAVQSPAILPKLQDVADGAKTPAGRKSRQMTTPAETVDAFAARFGRNVKRSPKTYLTRQHKAILATHRHISDFCKNLTKEGKNRTTHLAIYNENAVRLIKKKPDDGEYIHASHLRLTSDNYILAQGPTRKSGLDFYRMIWQQKVSLIVCLDNLTSPTNCIRYFSFNTGESCKVGSRFTVGTKSVYQTDYPPLTIFVLLLRNNDEKYDNIRQLKIILHKDWTFMTLPKSPRVILETLELMRLIGEGWKKKGREHRPVLIHGTYGVGRTGMYAVTALLCKQMWKLGQLSVLKAAIAVRRHRYGVLHTVDQFAVVLEAILEYAVALDLVESNEKIYKDAIAILRRVWQPLSPINS